MAKPEKNMIQSSQCAPISRAIMVVGWFFLFLGKLEENYIYPYLWLDGFLDSQLCTNLPDNTSREIGIPPNPPSSSPFLLLALVSFFRIASPVSASPKRTNLIRNISICPLRPLGGVGIIFMYVCIVTHALTRSLIPQIFLCS